LYDDIRNTCIRPLPLKVYQFALVVFYILAIILMAWLLRTSKDAFHIKTELRIISIIWIICIVLTEVQDFINLASWNQSMNSSFWILIGYILSFCVSGIYVYIVSRKSLLTKSTSKLVIKQDANLMIANLLHDEKFRNDFSKFLMLQLCIENLLFWEVVDSWKSSYTDQKQLQAKAIFDKFIAVDAPFAVNIGYETRKALENTFRSQNVNESMFDSAQREVEELMENDSMMHFLRSPFFRQLE